MNDLTTAFTVSLPTLAMIGRSFALRLRYSLSHWDSLIVASCAEAGVDTLLTEDMQHGAVYDSVRIENPLL